MHQFSRSFARAHGITAAIIAGYLAHRIAATRKRPGEGYRCTLDELKRPYPYLSRSAIAAALRRLRKAGVLNCHQINLRGYDRTCHYAFTSESALRQVSEDPIYFDVAEAVEHKIPAALVLTNLRMRITEEVGRKPELATRFVAPCFEGRDGVVVTPGQIVEAWDRHFARHQRTTTVPIVVASLRVIFGSTNVLVIGQIEIEHDATTGTLTLRRNADNYSRLLEFLVLLDGEVLA